MSDDLLISFNLFLPSSTPIESSGKCFILTSFLLIRHGLEVLTCRTFLAVTLLMGQNEIQLLYQFVDLE